MFIINNKDIKNKSQKRYDFFEEIAETSTSYITKVDKNGYIEYVNPAAKKVLGLAENHTLGGSHKD
ncbi:PAS domain S-box protein [Methanohalobium evestigatum]|uniref:PAS domain S-box protein n=1 Tax=Methanohalobium evestigatum TaxID=2322 RepID=UPI000677CF44|nr:PAS domain-containing protein [Methanohalobium evestigatum]